MLNNCLLQNEKKGGAKEIGKFQNLPRSGGKLGKQSEKEKRKPLGGILQIKKDRLKEKGKKQRKRGKKENLTRGKNEKRKNEYSEGGATPGRKPIGESAKKGCEGSRLEGFVGPTTSGD